MRQIEQQSFLSLLLAKYAFLRGVEDSTGSSTKPVQKDVFRQIKQLDVTKGGNAVTGEGVTKSGPED